MGQHAFGGHVGEAHRANHLFHSSLPTVILNGLKQGFHHFYIVNQVYPAKTHTFALPLLVGLVVDDSCYPTCQPAVLGQIAFGLTKFVSRILLFIEVF